MKKLKIGLLVAVLSLAVGVNSAFATANLTWSTASTVALTNPAENLTIASGSAAATLVVEAADIIVTADSATAFTVTSADRTLVPSSTSGITQTCTAGVSQIVIAAGTAARTISVTNPQCGAGNTGGGGGTPPSSDTTAPTGTVVIGAGATSTSMLATTLTLSATDNVGVTQMLVSNDAGFAGASWDAYATSKSWTLTSGDGVKTVYAQFKDAAGNTSAVASDTITVSGSGTTPPPPVTPPANPGACPNGNTWESNCTRAAPPGLEVAHEAGGNAYAFGTALVKLGSKSNACKAWQKFFNDKVGAHLVADGKCGKLTIAAAKAWQKSVGLTADGQLGAKSRQKAKMQ